LLVMMGAVKTVRLAVSLVAVLTALPATML
jgi:hypothetical protein